MTVFRHVLSSHLTDHTPECGYHTWPCLCLYSQWYWSPPCQNSSQILDNDPYRGPRFYILSTIPLLALLAGAPYPVSNSASVSIGFVVMCGSVGLPTQNPVSEFHATSSLFPMLLLGLKASSVIALSSDVVSNTPQTTCSDMHMLASC